MSTSGQFPSSGTNDWVEQLRDSLKEKRPPREDVVLKAAYNAGEYEAGGIDTPTLFAYFEGTLSREDRQEVESQAAASPHLMNRLARIGAIVARNREGGLASVNHENAAAAEKTPSPSSNAVAAASSATASRIKRDGHRVTLGPPSPALGDSLPRSQDCQPVPTEPDCEVFRSLENGRDELRIFHRSAPVGRLLGIRVREVEDGGGRYCGDSAQELDGFVVLRRGSKSTTTTTWILPPGFQNGEIELELIEIPPADLVAEDAPLIRASYESAGQDDPVAVTPLHEPRSAWQIWADAVLDDNSQQIPQAIREIAEGIAAS